MIFRARGIFSHGSNVPYCTHGGARPLWLARVHLWQSMEQTSVTSHSLRPPSETRQKWTKLPRYKGLLLQRCPVGLTGLHLSDPA